MFLYHTYEDVMLIFKLFKSHPFYFLKLFSLRLIFHILADWTNAQKKQKEHCPVFLAAIWSRSHAEPRLGDWQHHTVPLIDVLSDKLFKRWHCSFWEFLKLFILHPNHSLPSPLTSPIKNHFLCLSYHVCVCVCVLNMCHRAGDVSGQKTAPSISFNSCLRQPLSCWLLGVPGHTCQDSPVSTSISL